MPISEVNRCGEIILFFDITINQFKGNGHFPSCSLFGKARGLQARRCQGFAVAHYSITLSGLPLKTSDLCNVGVNFPKSADSGIKGLG